MDHTPFIVAAYTIAAVILGWCAVTPWLRFRRLRQELVRRMTRDANA